MADNPAPQSIPEAKPAEAAPNKAQAEFNKYTKRRQAQQTGAIPGAMPHGPGWAVPPSVAMLPPYHVGAGAATAPSLAGSLGDSLRLGVDILNAALAGSARLLGGIAGAGGYGYEGCGCESCCEPSCCEPDCCGCDCCHPGVGNCC